MKHDAREEWFWAKVSKSEHGCWLWTANKNHRGYGLFNIGNKSTGTAHRLAYQFAVGEIPIGLCVLHRCDNPACVRPDHLFLGTNADNTADMYAKGRAAIGERNGNAKLTDESVRLIREEYRAGGITHKQLAAKFGVHATTVAVLVRGRTWKHLNVKEHGAS